MLKDALIYSSRNVLTYNIVPYIILDKAPLTITTYIRLKKKLNTALTI